jgi:hypothetical protein
MRVSSHFCLEIPMNIACNSKNLTKMTFPCLPRGGKGEFYATTRATAWQKIKLHALSSKLLSNKFYHPRAPIRGLCLCLQSGDTCI